MYETVTGFFCLKLKISINTEPIGFSILCELHVGSVMVLGFFQFEICNDDLSYLNTNPLDARDISWRSKGIRNWP